MHEIFDFSIDFFVWIDNNPFFDDVYGNYSTIIIREHSVQYPPNNRYSSVILVH